MAEETKFTVQSILNRSFDPTNNRLMVSGDIASVSSTTDLQAVSPRVNGDVVYLTGYYTKGDGGAGVFYWDSTSTATADSGTIFSVSGVTTGRWKRIYVPGEVNVKWFGAKGDGTTDDSTAFVNARGLIERSIRTNLAPGADGNKIGTVTLYVPAGSYLITTAQAIMAAGTIVSRTTGWVLKGDGRYTTQILFQPTSDNVYLLSNDDKWLHLTFKDITFDCNRPSNLGHFMLSDSDGGAQNYVFERCQWTGTWGYTINLTGSDNNAETDFYHCGWKGSHGTSIYAGASDTSDQFVNYNFYGCNYEVDQGNFLWFEKGGNINVNGGGWIHRTSTAGTFITLKGSSHAAGVQRLEVLGLRLESRNFGDSKLIDSEWGNGNVAFINCDLGPSSSTPSGGYPPTSFHATFDFSSAAGSSVLFKSCTLLGRHEYKFDQDSHSRMHNVTYEDCTHLQQESIGDFIRFTDTGDGTNRAGIPVIHFRNSRGSSSTKQQPWDSDYHFNSQASGTSAYANAGILNERCVTLRHPVGCFPRTIDATVVDAWLPLYSYITRIEFFSPAGAVAETDSASFVITNGDGTTLARVATENHSLGFSHVCTPNLRCSDDNKRHITLDDGGDVSDQNFLAVCKVYYIG